MIYLAQSDTTAGFLSQDEKGLNALKNRSLATPCVECYADFKSFLQRRRAPKIHALRIRKAQKTSFILPSAKSFRICKDERHSAFLRATFAGSWAFSTSANEHGMAFDETWARAKADICADEILFDSAPSSIFKLSNTAIKKIR